MINPLAIDLYAGLGGWTEGLLDAGFEPIGFDVERHDYGTGGYPAQLVLQDVLTLHGRQFREAALIVSSPPCQEFSWMAMPWRLAKQVRAALRGDSFGMLDEATGEWYLDNPAKFPEGYTGSRTKAELTALFDACFRIQREAIEAAGHHIPLVVENVRGACEWVGRSRWNYGSFHLWGDVPALMPQTKAVQKFNPDGTAHPAGSWFAIADSKSRGGMKGSVGTINGSGKFREQSSWDRGQKVPGFRFDGSGKSFQSASVEGMAHNPDAAKVIGRDGRKVGHDWFGGYGGSFGWDCSPMRRGNSKGKARKAASAQIAKIPLVLARHIAQYWKPHAT